MQELYSDSLLFGGNFTDFERFLLLSRYFFVTLGTRYGIVPNTLKNMKNAFVSRETEALH